MPRSTFTNRVVSSAQVIRDDTDLSLGGIANVEWTTADGNANCLLVDFPTGGAVDVPVLLLALADADFGYFNGTTQPTLAIEDADGDSYAKISFSADDTPYLDVGGSATAFNFACPITVGVDDTGYDVQFFGATSGKSWLWDESADTMIVTGAATISDALTAAVVGSVAESTDARVCTSADYGKVIIMSHATACAVTLPANGAAAGSWIDFMWAGDDSLAATIAAATVDTLVTFNDATADSVTFASGHRIGAYVRCISDGTYWHAINLSGSNTMTVNT